MDERTISADDVREEHLADVNEWVQWTYLVAVIAGGTLLMLGVIALLGSSAG